jgi:hypothetical protein
MTLIKNNIMLDVIANKEVKNMDTLDGILYILEKVDSCDDLLSIMKFFNIDIEDHEDGFTCASKIFKRLRNFHKRKECYFSNKSNRIDQIIAIPI